MPTTRPKPCGKNCNKMLPRTPGRPRDRTLKPKFCRKRKPPGSLKEPGGKGLTNGLPSPHSRNPGQPLTANRLPQLEQPTSLDLPDAFTGDAIGPRHLVQGARLAIPQTEPQLDHLPLARRQRPQHLGNPLAQQVL